MTLRIFITLLLSFCSLQAQEQPVPSRRVGQPLVIQEVYIPGADVKPIPRRDRQPPLVVRILEAKPAKDGKRYDFEVQGMEAGTYNLADFLETADGSAAQFPAIPLEILSALPPGLGVPHAGEKGALPQLGGYRRNMIILGVLWVAGLAGILMWKKKKTGSEESVTASLTLAERLRPLVSRAAHGDLPLEDRARLERLVIGHWREKLPGIASLSPAEAMVRLRSDDQAAPLILALERWLHAPGATASPAEIEKLLAPYT